MDIYRSESCEEIKELNQLCKLGQLFEVQEWISSGKPVNPPVPPAKGNRPKSPLQYSIQQGFHSLVKVLLDAGAELETDRRYNPVIHALKICRLDIIKLVAEYGADLKSISMFMVFDSWQPDIMEYFINAGADVETENPLAYVSELRTWVTL